MARTHDLTRNSATVPLPPGKGGISHFRDPEGMSYIVYALENHLKIVRHTQDIGEDVLRDTIEIEEIRADLPSFRYDTHMMEGFVTFASLGTARFTRRYRSTDYGVTWEILNVDLTSQYKNFQLVRLGNRVFALAAKPMTPATAGYKWVARVAKVDTMTGDYIDWSAEAETGIDGASEHGDLDIRSDEALELIYLLKTGEPKRKVCVDYSLVTGVGVWHDG